MFKRFKSVFLIVLCLTFILSNSIAFGADQSLLHPKQLAPSSKVTVSGTLSKDALNSFILTAAKNDYTLIGNTKGIENYIGKKIIARGIVKKASLKKQVLVVESYNPSPSTVKPEIVTVTGNLKISNVEGKHYELATKDNGYVLTGKTDGLDKYPQGQVLEVKGYISDKPNIWMSGKLLEVVSYTAIARENKVIKLQGTLIVQKVDTSVNSKLPYTFSLKTATGPYDLTGKTDGLEKFDGQQIEVTGIISPLTIYPPIFRVDSFAPVKPKYETLQGTVGLLKSSSAEINSYTFSLKTSDTEYELIGNTKGLEQYIDKQVEVTGNYVETFAPTPYPLFSVESYKPIAVSSKIHTIVSDKPLYFSSPGESSSAASSCNVSISWSENTVKAFFDAKLTVAKDSYEFELVSAKSCENDSITGLYTISKNGKVVAKEIPGKLYGLNQPLGNYFKFYSDDMKWHMSAYITYRSDF